MVSDCTGVVLAGGRSSRMGRDKALIDIDGKPMLVRAAESLLAVTDAVVVVQDRRDHYNSLFAGNSQIRCIEDQAAYTGPLHGIIRALAVATRPWILVSPCDHPYIDAVLWQALLDLRRENLLAVVPEVEGVLQPLLAAYHVDRLKSALKAAAYRSPRAVLAAHRDQVEALQVDNIAWFMNLNEPYSLMNTKMPSP